MRKAWKAYTEAEADEIRRLRPTNTYAEISSIMAIPVARVKDIAQRFNIVPLPGGVKKT